jgi:hypothetical protein
MQALRRNHEADMSDSLPSKEQFFEWQWREAQHKFALVLINPNGSEYVLALCDRVVEVRNSLEPKPAASKELAKALQYALDYAAGRVGCVQHWKFVAEEALAKFARASAEPRTEWGGPTHICKNGKEQINRKENCHHCSEITYRAVDIAGDLFNVLEPVAKEIARLRTAPPPPVEHLRDALVHAVSVIQTWHNMGVPKAQRSELWDIYWKSAPEMVAIRNALTKEAGQ